MPLARKPVERPRRQAVTLLPGAPGYTDHRFLTRRPTMETIFDYAPTPDELRYLADTDAAAYRASVSPDEALVGLAMLFAMRDDGARSDAYIREISDDDLRFEFLYNDLISPSEEAKRSSVSEIKSKAA